MELNPESLSVELGFPIPVVSRIPDSLNSQFQSPGFLILQEKISRIPESQFPYMRRKIILTDFRQSYLLRLGGVYPPEFSLTIHGPATSWKIRKFYCPRLLLRFPTLTSLSYGPSVSLIKFISITSDLNLAYVCSFPCQVYGLIF